MDRDAEAAIEAALAEFAGLPKRTIPALRAVRRRLSARLAAAEPADVLLAAHRLIVSGERWMAYELVGTHGAAMASLGIAEVEALGSGMGRWEDTDIFGPYVAGPAWRLGRIGDEDVRRWTESPDRWWRRAALVATTSLNLKSKGATGDTARTLDIARRLAADRDDMVVKAVSWALRLLARWDAEAVRGFIASEPVAPRVRREVGNKLATGRKNPKSRRPEAA